MIRVLRVLEYTYDSVETMEADMKKWGVQGTYSGPGRTPRAAEDDPPRRIVIKSTVFPLEVIAAPVAPAAPPSAEE